MGGSEGGGWGVSDPPPSPGDAELLSKTLPCPPKLAVLGPFS